MFRFSKVDYNKTQKRTGKKRPPRMTLKELSDTTGFSYEKLRKLIKDSNLEYVKLGKGHHYNKKELLLWFKEICRNDQTIVS